MLNWSEDLSVGDSEIDADHKRFITMVNELNDTISQRKELGTIKQCMQAIIEDADSHFSRELELLKIQEREDIDIHRDRHQQTMDALHNIMSSFDEDSTEYLWIEGGLRVKQILVEHLLAECEDYRR
jgi:hemerythrin-like metal-binding protein